MSTRSASVDVFDPGNPDLVSRAKGTVPSAPDVVVVERAAPRRGRGLRHATPSATPIGSSSWRHPDRRRRGGGEERTRAGQRRRLATVMAVNSTETGARSSGLRQEVSG